MGSLPASQGMKILVCPSGFKGSLQPDVAADCIEAGIKSVMPEASVRKVPLVDGGEGFTSALVSATGGTLHPVTVTGPVGIPIASYFGILGSSVSETPKTAVIEMAAAAGLSLVPAHLRDPGLTTTFGVGELLAAALGAGAKRIVVGCGDSGTCDGGAGMLQALGARLIDQDGHSLPIAAGGESLLGLANIDLGGVDKRLKDVSIEVAVNWNNVLSGPEGVARVFGAQKGASTMQTERLSAAMEVLAVVTGRLLCDNKVGLSPGGGASGGLGTGLRLVGAKLRPRYEVVAEYVDFDGLFTDCDLVLTAEGGIDDQTPRGKIPAEIGMRAKKHGLPVIAIAGTIGPGARVNYDVGIDAYTCILQRPSTLDEAILEAEKLTRESAECVMRMIVVGRMLGSKKPFLMAQPPASTWV
ncbi:glycerate kinase [Colletotrichum tofieldiae]|uniref:Glycerate kinase n=1 Tax=Colletotrichum tofieldiae TaxID=708197 RepID=A0A166YN17_9PEZI|nr:glycerate kinase [Colletotrichum tofieldiae]GKT59791.1 glycerate kinase [Colletotrichum tofieldiae]GKT78587.1 glycerate kinase [Colletotrichum tofieldiae]GKT85967.1 glycerate kinase [Colletotrichum tofieldiae]